MMVAILILGLAVAAGVLVAMAVRDLASERQVMQSLWMTPIGVLLLALYISFTAGAFVSTPYGVTLVTFLIAMEAGAVGYMVGATLNLFGTSLRSSHR